MFSRDQLERAANLTEEDFVRLGLPENKLATPPSVTQIHRFLSTSACFRRYQTLQLVFSHAQCSPRVDHGPELRVASPTLESTWVTSGTEGLKSFPSSLSSQSFVKP